MPSNETLIKLIYFNHIILRFRLYDIIYILLIRIFNYDIIQHSMAKSGFPGKIDPFAYKNLPQFLSNGFLWYKNTHSFQSHLVVFHFAKAFLISMKTRLPMKISNQFFHQQWNCFQEYHVLTLALHTTYFPVLLPTDPSIKSYSSGTNKRYGPYPVGWHTVWTLKNWKLLTSDSDEFIVMKESERISIISLWGTNGKYLISDGTIKMMLLTKGL